MFFVFAGAGLALAVLVATAALTAPFLTLGTQNDLKKIKIKLLTFHYSMNDFNNSFPISDLLDQHEEGGETPTDQDVEKAMRILEEENSEEEDEPTMENAGGPAGLAESQAASDAEVAAAAKAAAAKKLAHAIQTAAKSAAAATASAAKPPYSSQNPEMPGISSISRDRFNSSSTTGTSSTNFSKTDSEMPPLYYTTKIKRENAITTRVLGGGGWTLLLRDY
jgi:hypothetical protein